MAWLFLPENELPQWQQKICYAENTDRPNYVVAKGGITSHDILTKGLSVKTARVMGQVINSVPCVMTECFPYIIFPGNVGGPRSLEEIYQVLK